MAPRRRAGDAALAFDEREYSLPALDALACGLAGVLARRGVRAGSRVALMSSNRPELVVALRAIWRLGAAVVLFSPAWKQAENVRGRRGHLHPVRSRESQRVLPVPHGGAE